MNRSIHHPLAFWTSCILAVLLSSCGGGGGADGGCTSFPGRDPSLPACAGSATPGGPAAIAPLAISLTDAAGATVITVSPQQAGVVKTVVKDGSGNPLPGVAVAFTTTDKTAALVPVSGTALTDASGLAQVGLPAGTQAGAFTVTATASKGSASVSGNTSYSVSFPALTLSALTIGPSPLGAGGTASLEVTVMDGSAPFMPAQSVTFTSPCATAGKAVISSPVTTVAGVASTSYIDKGCGAVDVITASTSMAGATVSQSGSLTVQSALAGQLSFVSALPQNIALKGTGGPGRQESSTVVFKVLDKNGNPVSGQLLTFGLTTDVGGLTRNPTSATTGADGTASTAVFAGTVNTPVRVIATVAGTTITTMSDQLVVSTGIPDQNSFTISTEIFNVEGWNYSGCPNPVGSSVTVRLADHFNNPAPDGTAVSFTAEGGTVDASCLTGLVSTTLTDGTVVTQKGVPGSCSVRFCAANPRPADGRVTVLAYALGEESFDDTNGLNLYFEANDAYQDLGEPFRNDRAVTDRNANANWGPTANWRPARPVVLSPDDGWTTGNGKRVAPETFIDSNSNQVWNENGDLAYNGVLKSAADFKTQVTHVRGALVQVLSTSAARITALDTHPVALSQCVTGTAFVNVAKSFRIAIRDTNPTVFALNGGLSGNILPAGTKIEFTTSNGKILSDPSYIVPNTNDPSAAAWTYTVLLQSDATQSSPAAFPPLYCSNEVTSGLLTVKVTSPMGVITTQSYSVTD